MKNSTWNKGIKVVEFIVVLLGFLLSYFALSYLVYLVER